MHSGKKKSEVPCFALDWYVRTIETRGRRCRIPRHGRKTAV